MWGKAAKGRFEELSLLVLAIACSADPESRNSFLDKNVRTSLDFLSPILNIFDQISLHKSSTLVGPSNPGDLGCNARLRS